MNELKLNLNNILEKYKIEYSNSFDRKGKSNSIANNVMLIANLLPQFAQELVDAKNYYCQNNNIIDTSEIDEIKDNVYMYFINFSTSFQG